MGRAPKRGRPDGVVLFGHALRARRQEMGLSQAGVSDLAKLGVRTVRTAESGEPVSPDTAKLLATTLGLAYLEVLRPSPRMVRERLEAAGLAPVRPREQILTLDQALDLHAALEDGAPTVCVEGPQGVGKATLVRGVLFERESTYPDGIVWVAAGRLQTRERLDRVRTEIATSLSFANRLPDPSIVSEEAYDQAFALQFWRGKRLLVLANLEDPQLLSAFTEGAQAKVVVTTSRRWVADLLPTPRIPLQAWTTDRTLELLTSIAGPSRFDAEPEGTQALLALIGGLPLYAHLLGTGLRRTRHRTLSDYVRQLRGATDGVQTTSQDEMIRGLVRALAPDLSTQGYSAVRDLALLGTSAFDEASAAAVLDRPLPYVRTVLDELSDAYLLHRSHDRHYSLADFAVGTWGEPSDDALANLLRSAPGLAEEAATDLDYHQAFVALDLLAPALRIALDAVLDRLQDATPARSPEDLSRRAPVTVEGAEVLPAVVCALGPLIRFDPPEGTGGWATAALRVCSPDDLDTRATLSWLLAMWWFRRGNDRAAACAWADEAVRASTPGDPDRAASIALHASILHQRHGGHAAAAASIRHACTLPGASDGMLAWAELNAAVNQTLTSDVEDSAAGLLSAVLARPPTPRLEVLRATTVVNQAVLRAARAEPVDADLVGSALHTVLTVLRPEPTLYAAAAELVEILGGQAMIEVPEILSHYLRLDRHEGEAVLAHLDGLLESIDATLLPNLGHIHCWMISGWPLASPPGIAFPLLLPTRRVRSMLIDSRAGLARFILALRNPEAPVLQRLNALEARSRD